MLGQRARRQNHSTQCECAAIGGDLPLVVSDHPNLQKLTQVFLDGQNLPYAPFIAECLTGRLIGIVRALPWRLNFPIGKEIGTGAFIFCDVESRSGKGKRMFVRGGNLDPKLKITVPGSVDAGG